MKESVMSESQLSEAMVTMNEMTGRADSIAGDFDTEILKSKTMETQSKVSGNPAKLKEAKTSSGASGFQSPNPKASTTSKPTKATKESDKGSTTTDPTPQSRKANPEQMIQRRDSELPDTSGKATIKAPDSTKQSQKSIASKASGLEDSKTKLASSFSKAKPAVAEKRPAVQSQTTGLKPTKSLASTSKAGTSSKASLIKK